MADRSPNDPQESYRAWALVGQLGLTISAPIVIGVLLGVYLDPILGGTGLVLIAGILLGVAGGFYGAYKIVAPFLK